MGIIVVSRYFTPSTSGTPSVLHALLKRINPRGYTVVTREIGHHEQTDDRRLLCEKTRVSIPKRIDENRLLKILFLPIYLVRILSSILITTLRRNPTAMLVIFPDAIFLSMAYLANRILKKSMIVYFHDTFVEQQKNVLSRAVATIIEKRVLSMAADVIVLNEALKALFRKKGIEAKIIRNTLDFSTKAAHDRPLRLEEVDSFRVVFTGSIYEMNLDALMHAARICSKLKSEGIEFIISTPSSKAILNKLDLKLDSDQVLFFSEYQHYVQFLRQSDLLLLPLAFNPPYPEETKTVLPAKAIDYMAAEVPILVLAPKHYYLSQYARRRGFALVVDSQSDSALIEAIRTLRDNSELRANLVRQAKLTLELHNPVMLTKKLISIMKRHANH
jgi:glycosyltransferase involved in cell wall biosynthesis